MATSRSATSSSALAEAGGEPDSHPDAAADPDPDADPDANADPDADAGCNADPDAGPRRLPVDSVGAVISPADAPANRHPRWPKLRVG